MLVKKVNEKLQWKDEFLSILGLKNDIYTIDEIEKKILEKCKKNDVNSDENLCKLINVPLGSTKIIRTSIMMNYILSKFIILENVPLYYRKDFELKKLSNSEVNQIIQNI